MKKNDIALLILVIAVTAGLAYFVGNTLLGKSTAKPVQVEKANTISADIVQPQPSVFNTNAINPTVKIQIGNTTGQQPFGQ